jgi:hypothetical protein
MARKRKHKGELQTVIVKKEVARTREDAKGLVGRYLKKRTYTSRETANAWRFRQRPPDCFRERTYGTKCFTVRGVSKGVCLVFGDLKRGARKRRACR